MWSELLRALEKADAALIGKARLSVSIELRPANQYGAYLPASDPGPEVIVVGMKAHRPGKSNLYTEVEITRAAFVDAPDAVFDMRLGGALDNLVAAAKEAP